MKHELTSIVNGSLNLLFPRNCYACQERIDQGWICTKCLGELKVGVRFGGAILPPLESVNAVWHYDGAVRAAIDDWKFSHLAQLGIHIIENAFTDEWLQEYAAGPFDAIVRIPPHSFHLRERGFDPVHQITKFVSAKTGVPEKPILLRKHAVKPQVASSLQDRVRNVRGIFSVRDSIECSILLIDDVITTGSTLREAAKALLANGANRVCAIVIASAGTRSIAQLDETTSVQNSEKVAFQNDIPI